MYFKTFPLEETQQAPYLDKDKTPCQLLSCSFAYSDAYLKRADAYAIDPALPLRSTFYHCEGMPGAMRDSSPDRWGRHLID